MIIARFSFDMPIASKTLADMAAKDLHDELGMPDDIIVDWEDVTPEDTGDLS